MCVDEATAKATITDKKPSDAFRKGASLPPFHM